MQDADRILAPNRARPVVYGPLLLALALSLAGACAALWAQFGPEIFATMISSAIALCV